ncbi:MAG: glycosyltransferase family 4 protein [Proteobacteria bacterium]|nr:glycosyltransferase family 4 protein [Pseudomonadota bacterium]
MKNGKRPTGPIAYLTGEYPAVSHTFILREVEALRALGADVITCSIRKTDPDQHRGKAEKDAFRTTFYVLARAKNPLNFIRDHVSMLLKSPSRYMKAFGLALKTRSPGLKSFFYQCFYFAEAVVLAQHLLKNNASHIHNHFGDSSCTVTMLASMMAEIPFSFTMHGPTEFFEIDLWFLEEKVARAAFVACISHFCRSQVMAFSNSAHWEKIRIVHCGVNPSLYSKSSKNFGKKLLFVGRLASVKGVPVLIDAFANILQKHPDARLTLIGDGPDRPAIEALISKHGLDENICITGYLSQLEVAERLSQSDIFILPSFAEGVPVVLMEAMASGLPVITTRIAGIPELVKDGKSGFVVPPSDTKGLEMRMLDLLDDPSMCERMGKVGRKKVRSEYESSHEASALLKLINASENTDL